MATDVRVHRFTTAEFERMASSGAFEDLHVELIDGLVVDVPLPREPHVRVTQNVMCLCAGRMDLLRVEAPLAVADGWVVVPDVALVEHDRDRTHWPTAALLAVEVSMTTQSLDRRKAAAYARGGVLRYWMIDVPRAIVLEHTEPGPDGYEVVSRLAADDVLDAGVDGVPTTTVVELLSI
jgi:Uma2 family endonuclease